MATAPQPCLPSVASKQPLCERCLCRSLYLTQPQLAAVNHLPREQVAETLAALPQEWERLRTSSGGLAVWGRKP
ncbi:MAG: hypothetical protein IMW90_08970 [Thermogemmatispora sp.]|jgi:hypothetical protein|uniref:hypothetical protein n=1 Tax=Thermogemmatispora sp. TaxID=1968838 RepID=UPI001A0BA59C|nr:hypothetical protein [Thermogemmatispora sp.]MBE3565843.1 hypothetical protein [Thermogemmatispora sp.]